MEQQTAPNKRHRPLRIFLSYTFGHEPFVQQVYESLKTQSKVVEPYFYSASRGAIAWTDEVRAALAKSKAFVLFLGSKLGDMQKKETDAVHLSHIKLRLWVQLAGAPDQQAEEFCHNLDPIRIAQLCGADRLDVSSLTPAEAEEAAEQCAREILRRLKLPWMRPEPDPSLSTTGNGIAGNGLVDLPRAYPFDYEKNIIDAFIRGGGRLPDDKIALGCTPTWPAVEKRLELDAHGLPAYRPNPVPSEILGDCRPLDAAIVVDARAGKLREVEHLWRENRHFLTFPEAGPRQAVCYPARDRRQLRVGILVSGGIAPGINAVIDGIVNRHTLYVQPDEAREPQYTLRVLGFLDGLMGLLHGTKPPIRLERGGPARELSLQAHSGGSLLRTSREDELLSDQDGKLMGRIVSKLTEEGPGKVDILYIIGGDGSMRAAHTIYTLAKRTGADLSVVTIPKTMDNDILWVWQSFGFLSAVEIAKAAILQLHVEAQSNPRLCVIQLFGSDSGFVASHAALASGVCDYVLIPEVGFNLRRMIEHMTSKLEARYNRDESPHGVIAMAETAIPRDYKDFYRETGLSEQEIKEVDSFAERQGRVHGQTPDLLRNAGLKIVSGALQAAIRRIERDRDYWSRYRVFTNEPRHLIRAIPPSTSDVIFAERLGTLAVDGAMAGYADFMVSQWLTEYVFVPLKLVVLGRKRVPPKGIFWRTVLAKTGQPDEDVEAWPQLSPS